MKRIVTIFLFCLVSYFAVGQNIEAKRISFGAAAKASTTGFGADLYCAFNDRLAVKAGFDLMSLNLDVNFDQGMVKLSSRAKVRTGSVSAGVGYQITNWLYVAGAVGVLDFNPEVMAYPTDGIQYGDIVLSPETVGEMKVNVKPSSPIAPYLGIGFGRYFSKNSRVSFGGELGMWFMGAPKLEVTATGMLTPTQSPEHIQRLENQLKSLSFYPVLKFNLNVRVFNL